MNVLLSVHLYPPSHCCGGEMYCHVLAKYLLSQGHSVRVLLHQAADHNITTMYEYEGVEVFPPYKTDTIINNLITWSHIIITHLEYCNWSIEIGRMFKKPVVFISHNTHPYPRLFDCQDNVGVIYNCHSMANILNYPNPSCVVHPPVDQKKIAAVNSRECITMVNLDENKGGKIFKRVAQALPNKKFLAVKGSYSEPSSIGQITDLPSNVTVLPNSPDIVQVYAKTSVLLVLSRYESWGMVATEAMANGIPVIATPTFGLKENCGEAGLFIPERGEIVTNEKTGEVISDDGEDYDIDPILKHIKKLENKKYYNSQSAKSLVRAKELSGVKELETFVQFLLSLIFR